MSLTCLNMYQSSSSKHGNQAKKQYILWAAGSSIFSILLVLIVILSCLMIKLEAKPNPSPSQISIVSKFTTSACKNTLYMDSCESMLLSVENVHRKTPKELFDLSVQFAVAQAHSARSLAHNYLKPMMINKKLGSSTPSLHAIEDCMELLDDSLRRLGDVLNLKTSSNSDDIRTWLSTAITNQETCLDGLQSQEISTYKHMMDSSSKNVSKLVSNSLALFKSVRTKETENSNPGGRRLLSDAFPTWVPAVERKLLEASTKDIGANAVVAKDGTGTHKTIAEALAFVSLVGDGRTVIHVKAGTYNENLKIPSSNNNVMLVGDGKGITVITGSKNVQDGSSLLQTATFAASGDGFIARDITFVNSAGPVKHQAIALLVSSDKSVFYRCSIVGYQDSLYTLSNRQFYRETDIYGTVDFIFGNSAVVFQSCNISPRKPMSQQKNFITAQGRTDPNQNTGISIHNCRISATSDLASAKNPTYLGRPWKAYSRTVIMQSFLDNSIHPAGWFPWAGGSSPKSIYYGEYMNSGPGAATSGRVKWPGNHPSLTTAEATQFTVANLIAGGAWLPATGVTYDSGL